MKQPGNKLAAILETNVFMRPLNHTFKHTNNLFNIPGIITSAIDQLPMAPDWPFHCSGYSGQFCPNNFAHFRKPEKDKALAEQWSFTKALRPDLKYSLFPLPRPMCLGRILFQNGIAMPCRGRGEGRSFPRSYWKTIYTKELRMHFWWYTKISDSNSSCNRLKW